MKLKKLAAGLAAFAGSVIMTCTGVFAMDRVSVHDPSIVKDNDTYYIFGSHRDFAKSSDLQNWKKFNNNIVTDYENVFAEAHEWTKYDKNGNATTNIQDNLWAPDVIYNETMGKWCMYMSVNGSDWNSVICLLTSDTIDGNYTYVGPVVYSGFTNRSGIAKHDWKKTDVPQVLGSSVTTLPSRYDTTDWAKINAIDPNVFYTQEGNLVMVYGSWSAGIYMLELDETTGLRDYNVNYGNAVKDGNDPYLGYKIAGGHYVSGEAPYIQYDNETGYYYLYVSYGNLEAAGGYSIRVFRSKQYNGNYVDTQGRSAIYTGFTQQVSPRGEKLFGNYYLSGCIMGYKAGGHNSILYDDDGKKYVVYHTRFNNNTEGHEVRVHQLYMNADGWPVVSPYEYKGETISKDGYDKSEVIGRYQIVDHGVSAQNNVTGRTPVGMLTSKYINLNSDHTVTGDLSGTWSVKENSSDITMTLSGKTYKGKVIKQKQETTATQKMCFTVASDRNNCIWGVNMPLIGKATSVKLSEPIIRATANQTLEVKATILPSNSSDKLHYISSDTDVVSVNQLGRITTKKVGYAVVTVRSIYGVQATCRVYVVPDKITNLSVKVSNSKAKLTWTAKKGALSYDVLRSNTVNGVYQKIGNTKGTSYTDETIKTNTTYYYKVLARGSQTNGGFNSDASNKVYFSLPSKPVKKSVSAIKGGLKIKLKKQIVSGYQVLYSTNKNFKSAKKKSFTVTGNDTITLNKLKSKKNYYVKIRGYQVINGNKVYGEYSKVMKKKTK